MRALEVVNCNRQERANICRLLLIFLRGRWVAGANKREREETSRRSRQVPRAKVFDREHLR